MNLFMFNVILFLVFFLAIAAVFDFYCGLNKNDKNDLLNLTPKSILTISLIVIIPAKDLVILHGCS